MLFIRLVPPPKAPGSPPGPLARLVTYSLVGLTLWLAMRMVEAGYPSPALAVCVLAMFPLWLTEEEYRGRW